jgi:hypothetical protein
MGKFSSSLDFIAETLPYHRLGRIVNERDGELQGGSRDGRSAFGTRRKSAATKTARPELRSL